MNTIGGYQVTKQLSEGSFGRTYLGKHTATGRKVCIKENAVGDPLGIKLFREEALILWDLHHESLVPIKDYIELEVNGEQYQFIVMKFVEATTLQEFVKKFGYISDEHICWILQCALKAFMYMHYYKVIHCDIKPENIMIEPVVHNLIIVDFGLAVSGDSTKASAKGGTPYYLPPEFETGLAPIEASDIYSLGAVGIFLAGGDNALISKSAPKDMKPELAEVLEKMTRRDPLARQQSAAEVMNDLIKAREKMFGRAESKEMMKLRDGTILTPKDL
jgi:serine/threonine-protein kinase